MKGGVAKTVIAPACQAGDRGFNPRRSRSIALEDHLQGLFFCGL